MQGEQDMVIKLWKTQCISPKFQINNYIKIAIIQEDWKITNKLTWD